MTERAYTGVFREGSGRHALWVAEWAGFEAKWKELSRDGLRLHSVSVSVVDGVAQYSGTYREGSGGHALWVSEWPSFEAKWQELSAAGLRLSSVAVFVEGGRTRFAGAYLPGTGGHALWSNPWPGFEAKWRELSEGGLRLVSVAATESDGRPLYVGAFLPGHGGHALWASPWDSFDAKWRELSAAGLRLSSVDTFTDGADQLWVGAYLPGTDGHGLWAGVDWESFTARWTAWSAAGLRLVDTAGSAHGCTSGALNQVVMPMGTYDYGVTGHDTVYHWPVLDTTGATRHARLSALTRVQPFLTLPFSDTDVTRGGIWRYDDGNHHHAGDYSQGDATFPVLASAPGRVEYVGWDSWSGNTVVLSHDVGGVADAYRTLSMHLRDGADHDADAAWTTTIPTLSGAELTDYTTHLTGTGATKDPATRSLDAAHWGTNAETILVEVGDTVQRGQQIGWAGNTGPGGKRGAGGPNTHLHIFWTVRDDDGRFYFFDPYGVYSLPDRYAAGTTDATTGPCVRYPVAWQDGRPQYPPAPRLFGARTRATRRVRRIPGPHG
ncbi:M23 family metallopeptidase [Oryzobacter terrae]|uniref:M23 family metallopeptidase n=1 Tax=Oryzobacter terrae TaxID=1620385 RepID=UPI003672176B